MPSDIHELRAMLSDSPVESGSVILLGARYQINLPALASFSDKLGAPTDFGLQWPELKHQLSLGLLSMTGVEADARMILLYSHYLAAVQSWELKNDHLPKNMVAWTGKGDSRRPVCDTVWFFLETEGIGSEAVRDVINVLGAEANFLHSKGERQSPADVLEQAGIYLAMLLHLRHKWPAYFEWMPMKGRLRQMTDLFLLGNEDLPIIRKNPGAKSEFIDDELVEMYYILSRTMYQLDFFLLLRDYADGLKENKGKMNLKTTRIREQLLA